MVWRTEKVKTSESRGKLCSCVIARHGAHVYIFMHINNGAYTVQNKEKSNGIIKILSPKDYFPKK